MTVLAIVAFRAPRWCLVIFHETEKLANLSLQWGFLWRCCTLALHFKRWLEFKFSLPFLWHYEDVVVATRSCAHFIPPWGRATSGSLACCLHLNPQEMENGLQFVKLMLRSVSLETQLFSGRGSHCVYDNCRQLTKAWANSNSNRNIVQAAWLKAQRLPVQLRLATGAELWTSADWPPAMFSLHACTGDLWWYFPFHTSVRGRTQRLPLYRETSVLQRHSLSGLEITSKERASCPGSKRFRKRGLGIF